MVFQGQYLFQIKYLLIIPLTLCNLVFLVELVSNYFVQQAVYVAYFNKHFIVQINFKFGSLGLFKFVWVQNNMQLRNLSSLDFKDFEGKNFNLLKLLNFGLHCTK